MSEVKEERKKRRTRRFCVLSVLAIVLMTVNDASLLAPVLTLVWVYTISILVLFIIVLIETDFLDRVIGGLKS